MNNYTELTERMNTAKAEALSIGECWNAMDEAADAIEALVAERDALRAELDAIKKQQGEQQCDTARVLEWMRTPNRKAAQFAFTEGPERQAAYWIEIAQSEPAAQQVAPVAWMYTLEYGAAVADTKVSVRQLNYPFGVCGADYLAKNDDGVSYVRQTPLYKAQSVPDSLLAKLPGGKKTDQWDSARMADYDQGWNDYRKAVKAVLAGAAPAVQPSQYGSKELQELIVQRAVEKAAPTIHQTKDR